ncbi:MAG: single-stranded DNA-binding protein [Clostridia bacterium]|nr:single-stranded DNA-binding protein [Clostridia bacterium]
MNKWLGMGNIARDIEFRTTQSGVDVCSFTIACNRRYVDKVSGKREADFISCVAFKATAGFIHKYFEKGMKIGVVGTLQTRSYDAQDGSKRYVTEVLVEEAEFVTPKADSAARPQANNTMQDVTQEEEDGLPF